VITEMQEVVTNWWRELQQNSGASARLRRCRSPLEAAMYPETHRLRLRLPKWLSTEAVATIAGIASHIKSNTDIPLAKALAKPHEANGRPPYSESRFRQLLLCRDWDELYRSLRRAVTVLDGAVSLASLTEVIRLWQNEFRGGFEKAGRGIRYQMSRAYYEVIIENEKHKSK
jgi:CRISPR type I-E-associated protein CasB/Cse2